MIRLFAPLVIASLVGCASPAAPDGAGRGAPVVRSLSRPVGWLVERLAGDAVTHDCVLPSGEDPATWAPGGDLVAELARADLLVMNGAGYEAWVQTASLPSGRLVDSTRGLRLVSREAQLHSHGGAAHEHGAVDPHTWLDPDLFAGQARAIAARLAPLVPEEPVAERLAALTDELSTLGLAWDEALAGVAERPLAAAHPSYDSLFARSARTITSFDLDPETPASATVRAAIGEWTRPGAMIWWESAPSPAVTDALPGIEHVTVSALEQDDQGGYDYLAQARAAVAVARAAGSAR